MLGFLTTSWVCCYIIPQHAHTIIILICCNVSFWAYTDTCLLDFCAFSTLSCGSAWMKATMPRALEPKWKGTTMQESNDALFGSTWKPRHWESSLENTQPHAPTSKLVGHSCFEKLECNHHSNLEKDLNDWHESFPWEQPCNQLTR